MICNKCTTTMVPPPVLRVHLLWPNGLSRQTLTRKPPSSVPGPPHATQHTRARPPGPQRVQDKTDTSATVRVGGWDATCRGDCVVSATASTAKADSPLSYLRRYYTCVTMLRAGGAVPDVSI